jgi:hypothetical protein
MEAPQMKRIIDGKTYNTETSTLVATSGWQLQDERSPHYGSECEGELYQTRGGAFFLVVTIHTETRDGEPIDKVECTAMSAEKANAWVVKGHDIEIVRDVFGEPPEAEAEDEPGATIYIRVPAALKRSVDEAAKEAKVSGNVWAMRCIERCLETTAKSKE